MSTPTRAVAKKKLYEKMDMAMDKKKGISEVGAACNTASRSWQYDRVQARDGHGYLAFFLNIIMPNFLSSFLSLALPSLMPFFLSIAMSIFSYSFFLATARVGVFILVLDRGWVAKPQPLTPCEANSREDQHEASGPVRVQQRNTRPHQERPTRHAVFALRREGGVHQAHQYTARLHEVCQPRIVEETEQALHCITEPG